MKLQLQASIVGLVLLFGLCLPGPGVPTARGQDRKVTAKWEYRAVSLGADAKEATRRLNELAAEGWQYVGPLGHNLVAFKRAERPADQGKPAEVSGTVTLDGKPLDSGVIVFTPTDGKSPTAGGAIKEGQFALRVHVGTMKVSIGVPKVIGKKKLYDTKDRPAHDIVAELLPARYNTQTELRVEVKAGANRLDFALRSK